MRAGQLRHRILFQLYEKKQNNETGEITKKWIKKITLWGSLEHINGQEFIVSDAKQNKINAKVIIRKTGSINEKMRVVFRGVKYNILSIVQDSKNSQFLTLFLSVNVNDG